jgi:outer membrane receptor for ferrienterochelin and colicin
MRIKMKSILLLFIFNVIILSNVIGQCVIRGKITDINGEVPIGVTFYLKSDNTVGTLSDINGEFSLKVSVLKSQVFVVSYVGYKKIEDTVDCTNGGIIIKNYVLEPTATTLNAVTIVGRTQNNFDAHMENKKKLSSNTLDFISAETIKKTVDANVASAITRVTGVSSTSTGLITVRGTGDRYLKTTINGSRIPTLDPFSNNIKLDIFPASLVDNIVVAKTASPDLPGDWAGAYISVETKQYPEKLAINMETSFGYNQQTTFQNVITSQRSSTDWLGFDNTFREHDHASYVQFNSKPTAYEELSALGLGDYYKNLGVTNTTPWNDTYLKLGLVELGLLGKAQFDDANAFESAKEKYNTMYYREHAYALLNADAVKSEKTLPDTWNNTTRKAPLNFSQSFSIGNQTKLFGKTLGYLAGFRYQSAIQYDPNSYGNRFGIESKIIDGQPAGYNVLDQEATKETRGWSALLGAAYKLNANNTISFVFMPNVTGVNNVRDLSTLITLGSDSGSVGRSIYQYYESRKQMIYQVKTEHYIPGSKLKIEFNASYTVGKSNLPDLKISPYIYPDAPIQNSPAYTGRYYRYLDENIFDSRLAIEFPLDNKAEFVRKLMFGAAYQNGNRQQDNYYYQLMEGNGSEYIRQANPDAAAYGLDRFDIVSILNHSLTGDHGDSLNSVQQYYNRFLYPNNRVFGKSNVKAGYVMIDYALTYAFRFSAGLRIEQAYIHTDCNLFDELHLAANDSRRAFVAPSPILDIMIRPGDLNELSFLPSASLIIKLKHDEISPINLRLNYSKTVARPSIRELSDNAYFDYELNKVVYGNSLLKMVEINNYDLRLESYFKSGDNVSVSLFYKDFKNHIEVADFGQYLIWINNENIAWVKGIELEGKTNLTKSLEFRANITLVDSRSAFNTSYLKADGYFVPGRDIDRTMLNQAPYVVNTMLTYFAEKAGLTASLSYNIQGPRVISTGSYKDIPDVYELPRNLVDIKVIKSLGKHYNISLKVMDVLNTAIVRAYKIDGKYDLVYDSYKYGTNYVFAFSYKF